jgi:pimeloyl-ACP methyl ester carboxylesterase
MWALKLGIQIASPFITRDRRWPEMIGEDLSQVTLESFLMSIASLRRTDLRPYLAPIKRPIMGMYGDMDVIVNPNQWSLLRNGAPHSQIERYPKAGHFIMLDEPGRFMNSLKYFLDY